MTDTPPVPPTPETPATPAAAGVPAGAPAAGPKQGLSLTSFILGIAGIVFSWVPVLGFLASLAAIILGFIGRKNEPAAPKWMALVGIILGFVAIVIGLIVVILWIVAIVASASLGSYSTY
jgi:hypothetical protein